MKPSVKMPEATFRRRMRKVALAFHRVLKTLREADSAVEELLDLLEDPRYGDAYAESEYRSWNHLNGGGVIKEKFFSDLPCIIRDAQGVLWALGVHHGHFSCVNPGGWLPKNVPDESDEPASDLFACG